MKKFIAHNWIVLVIGISLVGSAVLAFRNNFIIEKNHQLQQQTELIKQQTQDILSGTMHGVDLGVRGFALTQDDKLLRPYEEAMQKNSIIFYRLDSLLKEQQYQDEGKLAEVKKEVYDYVKFSKEMIEVARSNDMERFTAMLKQDKGYDVWKKYDDFARPLIAHENYLNQAALIDYKAAIKSNAILQIALIVLLLPLLYLFIHNMRKERDARQLLLQKVQENDRTYVFDNGERLNGSDNGANDTSMQNVIHATQFIRNIAQGNYDVEWPGLNENNRELNNNTLVGNLIHLKERLKNVKEEDEKRNWMNEGLAKFSEIVRNHQHDMNALSNQCVSYLTEYLKAQQSSLFVLTDEEKDPHLNLVACYAFNRKKFIEKRIEVGGGLVGQAFLEGEAVILKQVPPGYLQITSGLGEASPRNLIIVPFKYDIRTIAVIELATFDDFQDHHIQFLKKAGEFLASAILNSSTTLKMKTLLEEAAVNEEQMRQREEELRQNMEELQATQEDLLRKNKEEE